MNIQTNNTDCNGIEIVNHDGTLRVSSREVAEKFGKRHDHVLRAIRNLIRKSPDWGSVHFLQFKVNDLTGESTSHVEMTRDGFSMLVMGFTGQHAVECKIKFLEGFDAISPDTTSTGNRRHPPISHSRSGGMSDKKTPPANNTDNNNIEIVERDGTLRVSSREVAEKFGKEHRNIVRSIESMEIPEEYRLRNFEQTVVERPNPSGGAPIKSKAYDMTRDGFTLLVMGFTGQIAMRWKVKFLDAFNAMEERLRNPVALSGPQLMAAALLEADTTMKAQARQIEAMQEDVQAHQRLVQADGSLNITEAAKNLGLRPKDLFGWLSHNGWIYKRPGGSSWLGYQSKCNSGLMEHKSTTVLRADGSERISEQVRVTPKGLDRLARLTDSHVHLVGGTDVVVH